MNAKLGAEARTATTTRPLTYVSFDLETIPTPQALAEPPPEFRPDGRLKDPAKIAADIARKRAEWEAERIKECSTTPHLCRIVAAGAVGVIDGKPFEKDWVARDEAEEQPLLLGLWAVLDEVFNQHRGTIVTFNGLEFDLQVLYLRSMCLGVLPKIRKSTLSKRYQYSGHYDVRAVFVNFGFRPKGKLDDYCNLLHVDSPKEEMDGSKVWSAYCEKQWDDLRRYARADARAAAQIFELMVPYYN